MSIHGALGAFAVVAGLTVLCSPSVMAQGLANLHTQIRVGNKICFLDHFHDGFSSGHASRKSALREAISSWQGFTAWEYGSAWGSFKLARRQGVNCQQSGGSWSCSVTAIPCRRHSRR